jgi:hypothetical protein
MHLAPEPNLSQPPQQARRPDLQLPAPADSPPPGGSWAVPTAPQIAEMPLPAPVPVLTTAFPEPPATQPMGPYTPTDAERKIISAIEDGRRARAATSATSATSPMPTSLDDVLGSLYLMMVSRRHRSHLPDQIVGRPLTDGLAAILVRVTGPAAADVGDESPLVLPVTEPELVAWNLTLEMAVDLAERQTHRLAANSAQTITVDGVSTLVVESHFPIAATAMLWVGELLGMPAMESTLVALPSQNVLVAQQGAERRTETFNTIVDFLRSESAEQPKRLSGSADRPTLLDPTLLRTLHGVHEIIGDLGSAAGRLRMAAAKRHNFTANNLIANAPQEVLEPIGW